MKKVKSLVSVILALAICLSFCSCHATKGGAIKYSNVATEKELSDLTKLLTKAGLKSDCVNTVVASVKDYNNTIGEDLLGGGKIDLENPIPQYDSVEIDNRWLAKNEIFVGYNCRLTAFQLVKDFVTVADVSKSNPIGLFMDEDALNNSKDNYFTTGDLEKFEAIYSTINTTSSLDSEEQHKVQKEYWDSIGLKFSLPKGVSLISVYLHNHFSEEENELIVGHTGVLVEDKGGYSFFEKLSFQLPYQVVRFNSKEELKQYLMAAYDTDTTGESAKPFILENGELL